MSFLWIAVDQVAVATVDTDGREVIAIRVSGTTVDDDYADLHVMGGKCDHEGTTEYRIWVEQCL